MNINFNQWNFIKQKLNSDHKFPTFKEREIWWCSIGLNIGHEEYGKGQDYSRPVLIIKKFNHHLFFGIPLTTQIKEKYYYHKILFKEKEQCVMLSQLRIFGSKRLINKMGQLQKSQFDEIREILRKMF